MYDIIIKNRDAGLGENGYGHMKKRKGICEKKLKVISMTDFQVMTTTQFCHDFIFLEGEVPRLMKHERKRTKSKWSI